MDEMNIEKIMSNRQQQNMDQSEMKNLETDNRNFADQLNQCRAREIRLM